MHLKTEEAEKTQAIILLMHNLDELKIRFKYYMEFIKTRKQ